MAGAIPFPKARTVPSRDFMVRQAVLNAMEHEFPHSVKADGVSNVLKRLTTVPLIPANYAAYQNVSWVNQIRVEFNKIAATWGLR